MALKSTLKTRNCVVWTIEKYSWDQNYDHLSQCFTFMNLEWNFCLFGKCAMYLYSQNGRAKFPSFDVLVHIENPRKGSVPLLCKRTTVSMGFHQIWKASKADILKEIPDLKSCSGLTFVCVFHAPTESMLSIKKGKVSEACGSIFSDFSTGASSTSTQETQPREAAASTCSGLTTAKSPMRAVLLRTLKEISETLGATFRRFSDMSEVSEPKSTPASAPVSSFYYGPHSTRESPRRDSKPPTSPLARFSTGGVSDAAQGTENRLSPPSNIRVRRRIIISKKNRAAEPRDSPASSADFGFPLELTSHISRTYSYCKHKSVQVSLDTVTRNPSESSSFLDSSLNLESLSQDLSNLLDSSLIPDVQLKIGDLAFPAHRAVLAARSEVFSAMFQHEMTESITGVLEIKDMEPTVLAVFLQYLYTGKVPDNLKEDMIPKLYVASDKYAVLTLRKMCSDFMIKSLSVRNFLEFLTLADTHSDNEFKGAVFDFIAKHGDLLASDMWISFKRQCPCLGQEIYKNFFMKNHFKA